MDGYHENYRKLKHYGIFLIGLSLILVASSITSALTQISRVSAVGSIYITPASTTVVHGNNVTLSLRINPTTAVTDENIQYTMLSIAATTIPLTDKRRYTCGTTALRPPTIAQRPDSSSRAICGTMAYYSLMTVHILTLASTIDR